MKHLNDIVKEGLLDDFDKIEGDFLKTNVKDWVADNVVTNKGVVYAKNGVRFYGDVIIKGYKEESLPAEFKIIDCKGDFKMEKCPNITSLEGIFDDYVKIGGDFVVSNCPKLTSLAGSPFSVEGNLSLVSNPMLKSLEGCPKMAWGKIYIMKNGKKFSKNVIKSYIDAKIDDDIFCGVEDEEANVVEGLSIFEELNEPHLLRLAKQLKDHPIKPESREGKHSNFNQIFGGRYSINWANKPTRDRTRFDIPYDEIDSSNVKEYKDKDEIKTMTRKLISSSRSSIRGLVLLMKGDEYVAAIHHSKQVTMLRPRWIDNPWKFNDFFYRENLGSWNNIEYSEVMELIDLAEKAVIITWGEAEVKRMWDKQKARRDSRQGMIENTPEQNEKIAKENRDRYVKLALQLKAQKSKEYVEIDDKVEQLIMRVLKISRKAKVNPEKYDKYDVANLNSKIYGEQTSYYERGKRYTQSSNGVLYYYSLYTKYYMMNAEGNADNSDKRYMDNYRQRVLDKVKEVEDWMARRGW